VTQTKLDYEGLLINPTFDQILEDLSEMFKTAVWRLYTIEGRRVSKNKTLDIMRY
jgi:hypothetical protein